MKDLATRRALRCAIYTRVSTDQGLEQDFNSLDAQREASEAYIKSQAHEGWRLIRDHYSDGGYSGGSMERPALQKLLADVEARRIDVIVVYKVDRLTRSLADFAKLVEMFDRHEVSFVSVKPVASGLRSRGVNSSRTATLETEICGQTLGAPYPRESAKRAEPTAETSSTRTCYGNVGLFPTPLITSVHDDFLVDLRGFELTSPPRAFARTRHSHRVRTAAAPIFASNTMTEFVISN